MKKIQIFIVIFFIMLLFPTVYAGDTSVSPTKVIISMQNGNFTNGNTSKKITVTNSLNSTYNVTWYIEHPKPSSMAPNKTNIPDLSWVDVEPKWFEIPPKSKGTFYVYLDIPETQENCNKNWETWVTFKSVEQGFINYEYAVRIYIDTPLSVPASSEDKTNMPFLEIAILSIVIIVLMAVIIIFGKNKKN